MEARVITKDNCPYCVKAKSLLTIKGIPYTEQKLGVDLTVDELRTLLPDARTVPQIWLDDLYVGGYTQLESYFEKVENGTGHQR